MGPRLIQTPHLISPPHLISSHAGKLRVGLLVRSLSTEGDESGRNLIQRRLGTFVGGSRSIKIHTHQGHYNLNQLINRMFLVNKPVSSDPEVEPEDVSDSDVSDSQTS